MGVVSSGLDALQLIVLSVVHSLGLYAWRTRTLPPPRFYIVNMNFLTSQNNHL